MGQDTSAEKDWRKLEEKPEGWKLLQASSSLWSEPADREKERCDLSVLERGSISCRVGSERCSSRRECSRCLAIMLRTLFSIKDASSEIEDGKMRVCRI